MDEYRLLKFKRSNQDTCINQKPLVQRGRRSRRAQVLADGPATEDGELALGRNVLVAFMPWGGYNFEDAIVFSERFVKEDKFTSLHIEEFELQVRDTKRGIEEITREIPNVGEEALQEPRRGRHRPHRRPRARPGDILVGKVTPKGETELSPEERLLRAIFGEKAGDVKDASLKAPPGMDGIVVDVEVFSPPGAHRRGPRRRRRSSSSALKRAARPQREKVKDLRTSGCTSCSLGETATSSSTPRPARSSSRPARKITAEAPRGARLRPPCTGACRW